jgi:glycosyltransferase involved in cell wall biosynthesis
LKSVAIITRTKNRTILLRRALQTVLDQSFQDWVHVIVNDGGDPQAVQKLLEEMGLGGSPRHQVLHHPTSLGMEGASNAGIRASQSKYLVILDDDDSWDPKFLEESLNVLESPLFPSIKGVVSHSTRIVEEVHGNQVTEKYREKFNPWLENLSLSQICRRNLFTVNSFMFQRDCLEKVGLYNELLPVQGDWEFNLRFLSHYDIFVLKKQLSYFHHRESSSCQHMSNTVIAAVDRHKFYEQMIRNSFLRKDLQEGKYGLGMLLVQESSFVRMESITVEKVWHRYPTLGIPVRILKKILCFGKKVCGRK